MLGNESVRDVQVKCVCLCGRKRVRKRMGVCEKGSERESSHTRSKLVASCVCPCHEGSVSVSWE